MRLRIRFSKQGPVRFTSHRDVARMWERALRRAEVPVALTGGFTPRPKLSFGLALSTGHESLAEYLDVEVTSGDGPPLTPDGELLARLDDALPPGMAATAMARLEAGAASLQEVVDLCSWAIDLPAVTPERVEAAVDRLLAASRVVVRRTRKGAESDDDIRPGVVALAVAGEPVVPGSVRVIADLATRPRALRPQELASALVPEVVEAIERDDLDAEIRAVRLHQWIVRDGARWEPLPAPAAATSAPHAIGACG